MSHLFLVDDIELWGHIGITLGFSAVSVYSPKWNFFITILANVPEVEKLFYGVSNLQAYLIENILGKKVIEDKIGIET